MHLRPGTRGVDNLDCRWDFGILQGVMDGSCECIIGTLEGIVKANTVKRRPIEERWSREAIEEMRGLPWDKKCRGGGGGGGVRRRKEGEGDKDEEKREPQPRGPCDEPGEAEKIQDHQTDDPEVRADRRMPRMHHRNEARTHGGA